MHDSNLDTADDAKTRERWPLGLFRSIVTVGALSAMCLYFLYGAIAGDLTISARNGPVIHLYGLAAWLALVVPTSIGASLAIRAGLVEFSNDLTQRATEVGLLLGGAGLFVLLTNLQRG
jgi:hypothetical protein